MKNYILKIIWSLIIISIMGVSDISIVPSKITYAKELTSVTNDEEVESKLNSLYDYINTMKSDVELINELDPISYVKSYIEKSIPLRGIVKNRSIEQALPDICELHKHIFGKELIDTTKDR